MKNGVKTSVENIKALKDKREMSLVVSLLKSPTTIIINIHKDFKSWFTNTHSKSFLCETDSLNFISLDNISFENRCTSVHDDCQYPTSQFCFVYKTSCMKIVFLNDVMFCVHSKCLEHIVQDP